ncbi:MAG TPA: hypothetical protein VLA09_00035, partial [Longimicrobiales bacterium]|nr:hypothetical protein [Longimicrobiales bacterium]
GTQTVETTLVTDALGQAFAVLDAGTYDVVETDSRGLVDVTGPVLGVEVSAGDTTDVAWSNQDTIPDGTLRVQKEVLDPNGAPDPEADRSGFVFEVLVAGTQTVETTLVTDALGQAFAVLDAGTYDVVETDSRGLVDVTGPVLGVEVSAGDTTDVAWSNQDTIPDGTLEITKTGPDSVELGAQFTYTITFTNTDDDVAATNVVVRDTLPDGVIFVDASNGATESGRVVTWDTIASLAPGASGTETVTVQADSTLLSVGDTLTNLAIANADNAAADSSVWRTAVVDSALLTITKTAPSRAEVGGEITYTLTVTNETAVAATNVVVRDMLPAGVVFASATIGGTNRAGAVTWPTIASLAPGDSLIYELTAVLTAVGTVRNVATVTSDSPGGTAQADAVTRVEVPFSDEGMILGKVFIDFPEPSADFDCPCPCLQDRQAIGAPGIPGVRVYLQDGTSAITDSEGKYHFFGLSPRLWVVKVDPTTLPAAARLTPLTNRHASDGASAFVDLKQYELARADFADGSGHCEVEKEARVRRLETASRGLDPERYRTVARSNGLRGFSTYSPLLADAPVLAGEFPMEPAPSPVSAVDRPAPVPPEPPSALLAAGLVEARLDLRSLTDGELGLGLQRDRFEDELRSFQADGENGQVRAGARAALFMKGSVRDDYEVTVRLDSEEDDRSRLFRDIRPDELYPVYGDASIQEFDAQSRGRLFGQIRRGASYLTLGDFNTGLGPYGQTGSRALGEYNRTLNGVMERFESERVVVNGFASRDRSIQVVDEIPGAGISGPYQLRRTDGLLNSEKVEVITRDRNQPAVILQTRSMERFTDYTVEPFSGRIIFKQPIPSVDGDLNPVLIRVSYEVENGGDRFWIYGADGQVKPWESLEVGGGFVIDDNPMSRFELASVNATLGLAEGTFVFGELARTDGATTASGGASRLGFRHASDGLTASFLYLDTDETFNNPSAAFGVGRREISLRTAARVSDRTRLFGELLRTENRVTGGNRQGGRLGLERAFGEWVTGQLAYRHADETDSATTGSSPDDPPEVNTVGARLSARVPRATNLALSAELEQDVSRSDQRRAWVGADYRIPNRAQLYARHEFINSLSGPYGLNPDQERNSTVFGVSADYRSGQQVFSEYRLRDAIGGREAQAAIGLRNTWTVAEGTRVSTSLERLAPFNGAGGTATALTGGIELAGDSLWRGSARAEYRARNGSDQIFGSLGYARKITSDFTLLANTAFNAALGEGRSFERTRVGIAWRETNQNRWNALARYEHRYDSDPDPDASDAETRRAAHILWSHLSYQPTAELILRGIWASKVVTGETLGVDFSDNAHLVGLRGTLDVTERVDVGVIGRTRFSQAFENAQYGLGAEVGVLVGRNLRVAAGYNVFGFRDRDFSSEGSTDHGFYLQVGFKFDEALFGRQQPQARRPGPATLDPCACQCCSARLEIHKWGPATGVVNDTLEYTLQVKNHGPSAAVNVVVRDTLPDRVIFVDASNGATESGRVVTWDTIPSLAPGDSVTRTITVQDTSVVEGTLRNLAIAAADNAAADSSVWRTAVRRGVLIVKRRIGPRFVATLEDVLYEVEVTNQTDERIEGIVLSDSLPAGVRLIYASGAYSRSGDALAWPPFELEGRASRMDTVIVRTGTVPAAMVNRACVEYSTLSSCDSDTIPPPPGGTIRITKTVLGTDSLPDPAADPSGFVFDVLVAGTQTIETTLVTDALGQASALLDVGRYDVTERPRSGFVDLTRSENAEVVANSTTTVAWRNRQDTTQIRRGTLEITKTVLGTDSLPDPAADPSGFVFDVLVAGTQTIDTTLVTDALGTASALLDVGRYDVTERPRSGFVDLTRSASAQVVTDSATTVAWTNLQDTTTRRGTLEITKTVLGPDSLP